MRLIRGIHNLNQFTPGCVATIGNFDGVHRGHQAILQQIRAQGSALGLPTVVMVFEPQPREFFDPVSAPPRLTRFSEKFRLLQAQGIDALVCLSFNNRLRSLTGEAFINQVLVEGLGVRHLVVGDDFRFGSDRGGDFSLLQSLGKKRGFAVERTQTVTESSNRISSTAVRHALGEGDLNLAARLLGRPYAVTGRVGYGQQLGRTLGFATANLVLSRQSLALSGVYAMIVTLPDGQCRQAMGNAGLKPTVGGKRPSLEVHLFDFDGDLYGQTINVQFAHKIRDEHKFNDLAELKHHIQQDAIAAKAFFAGEAMARETIESP